MNHLIRFFKKASFIEWSAACSVGLVLLALSMPQLIRFSHHGSDSLAQSFLDRFGHAIQHIHQQWLFKSDQSIVHNGTTLRMNQTGYPQDTCTKIWQALLEEDAGYIAEDEGHLCHFRDNLGEGEHIITYNTQTGEVVLHNLV